MCCIYVKIWACKTDFFPSLISKLTAPSDFLSTPLLLQWQTLTISGLTLISLFESTYGINIINNIYYTHLLSTYKIPSNVPNASYALSHVNHTGEALELQVIYYHLHDNEEFKGYFPPSSDWQIGIYQILGSKSLHSRAKYSLWIISLYPYIHLCNNSVTGRWEILGITD